MKTRRLARAVGKGSCGLRACQASGEVSMMRKRREGGAAVSGCCQFGKH